MYNMGEGFYIAFENIYIIGAELGKRFFLHHCTGQNCFLGLLKNFLPFIVKLANQ